MKNTQNVSHCLSQMLWYILIMFRYSCEWYFSLFCSYLEQIFDVEAESPRIETVTVMIYPFVRSWRNKSRHQFFFIQWNLVIFISNADKFVNYHFLSRLLKYCQHASLANHLLIKSLFRINSFVFSIFLVHFLNNYKYTVHWFDIFSNNSEWS